MDNFTSNLKVTYVKNKITVIAVLTLVFIATASAAVVSVDNINYEGNIDGFDSEVFTAYFINDESTDKVQAYLSPEQLSDAAGEERQTRQGVEISAETLSFEARYGVNKRSDKQPIYEELKVIESPWYDKKDSPELENWAQANCIDADNSGSIDNDVLVAARAAVDIDLYDWKAYCLSPNDKEGKWVVHSLEDTADTVFESQFRVQADGKAAQTGTLSNADLGQGVREDISDNVAVEWQGNLPTGQTPPGTSDYLAIKNRQSGDWRLITDSSYQNYVNYLDQAQDKLEKNANCDDILIDKWAGGTCLTDETINSNLESLISGATNPVTGTELSKNGEFRDGMYVKELGYNVAFPSFLIYIDGADYVNVEKTAGVPKIEYPIEAPDITNPMKEGQTVATGLVNVTVRNTGDAEGTFSSRISQCGDRFTPVSPAEREKVAAGDATTFSHEISFSSGTEFSSETFTDSCSVEVVDTSSGNSDSKSFQVAAEAVEDCRPGSWFTESEGNKTAIYQWGDSCDKQIEKDICEGDEEAVPDGNGGLECVEKSSPDIVEDCEREALGGLVTYEDPVCASLNKATGGFLNASTSQAFKWLATLAGFLAAFGAARGRYARKIGIEDERTKNALGLSVATLIALSIYLLWGVVVGLLTNPITLILVLVLAGVLIYFGSPLMAVLYSKIAG